ncbi:hypothetical protein NIES4072_29260 [Nostoc commune NIES-4072]|uniref:Uncharacterized protein n=1 Tax=Nostoc commune NIES-4072 TaxID=2005467 RepID=A0A2R5FML0_NOSCO|nr:hypothetical protein NIES4070_61490 [Nostoc commune HK-02]GBG19259.1 hypothetical protein NIES4072_29260 [Nostoc commune NIES-4072]
MVFNLAPPLTKVKGGARFCTLLNPLSQAPVYTQVIRLLKIQVSITPSKYCNKELLTTTHRQSLTNQLSR